MKRKLTLKDIIKKMVAFRNDKVMYDFYLKLYKWAKENPSEIRAC